MPILTIMGITRMAEEALFDLMTWMSPSWPIGAFAHSSGLEWAVEEGFVTDRATTREWIGALLVDGPLHNDTLFFVHAWRGATEGDKSRVADIATLAGAAQMGHERVVESTAQGGAFRRIALSATTPSPFGELLDGFADDELPYPVAAAVLFSCHAIPLRPALTAWLHGAVANLVSAAQRLVPLGQTDGQRVIHELRQDVFEAVERGLALDDGDPFAAMGGCALVADLGCMAHETQYTRLFRT